MVKFVVFLTHIDHGQFGNQDFGDHFKDCIFHFEVQVMGTLEEEKWQDPDHRLKDSALWKRGSGGRSGHTDA